MTESTVEVSPGMSVDITRRVLLEFVHATADGVKNIISQFRDLCFAIKDAVLEVRFNLMYSAYLIKTLMRHEHLQTRSSWNQALCICARILGGFKAARRLIPRRRKP